MKQSEDECQNGKINIDSLVDPLHNKSDVGYDDDLEICIKASKDGNVNTKSNLT
jgi:hypothetical protein